MTPTAPGGGSTTPAEAGNGGPARAGRRVVITGLGPITASGIGVDSFWQGLHRRVSPIRRIRRFDPSPFRSQVAAEVDDFEPTDFMDRSRARRLDRFGQFALAAARLAVEDAALDPGSVDPDRAAVQMGSALGGVVQAETEVGAFMARGIRGVNPRLATTVFCGAASCQVAIELGFTGPNSTNAMSCASGTIAVGDAWRILRDGRADVAVTGGMEAPLAPLAYGAFSIIRAMSTRNDDPSRACRPFDRGRDGFVMGEGACALVVETLDHARRRGARIYAEILGYGTTNDAHHMTAPRPDGSKAATAMTEALRSAGVDAGEVEWVNAHGSSTPLNDPTETLAIRRALGEHARSVPVSGTKAFYGHALGASGAIEAAITALALQRGWLPPTLNLEDPDDDCDLDHVPPSGLERRIRTAVSNSFGFGGINATLVFRRIDPSA